MFETFSNKDLLKIINSKGTKFLWNDIEYINLGKNIIKNDYETINHKFHRFDRKNIKILSTDCKIEKYIVQYTKKEKSFSKEFSNISEVKSHYISLLKDNLITSHELRNNTILKKNIITNEIVEDNSFNPNMLKIMADIYDKIKNFWCPQYIKDHCFRSFDQEFSILYFNKKKHQNINFDVNRIKKSFPTVKIHENKHGVFIKIDEIFDEERLFYFRLIESSNQFNNCFIFKDLKLTSII